MYPILETLQGAEFPITFLLFALFKLLQKAFHQEILGHLYDPNTHCCSPNLVLLLYHLMFIFFTEEPIRAEVHYHRFLVSSLRLNNEGFSPPLFVGHIFQLFNDFC